MARKNLRIVLVWIFVLAFSISLFWVRVSYVAGIGGPLYCFSFSLRRRSSNQCPRDRIEGITNYVLPSLSSAQSEGTKIRTSFISPRTNTTLYDASR
jgi:hypothetical protein